MRDWTSQMMMIKRKLISEGLDAYLIGLGVVEFMETGDIVRETPTISTRAKPYQLVEIFRGKKINKEDRIDMKLNINGIDVVTHRYISYSSSSNKITIPLTTIHEVLSKKDFTIEAIAVNLENNHCLDPYHGRADYKDGIIRLVDSRDVNRKIEDDPFIIIKGCRLATGIFNGDLSERTINIFIYNRNLLNKVSKQRIRDEVIKIMRMENPSMFIINLITVNCLHHVFPTLIPCINHSGGGNHSEHIFDHLLLTMENISKRFPLIRLAALLHDIGKPNVFIQNRKKGINNFKGHAKISGEIVFEELMNLEFYYKDSNFISNLINIHMRDISSKKSARKLNGLLEDAGISFVDFLRLKIADRKANIGADHFKYSEIKKMYRLLMNNKESKNKNRFKDLDINGVEVMEVTGLKPSPKVGKVLDRLLDAVRQDSTKNKNHELKRIAKVLVERRYI